MSTNELNRDAITADSAVIEMRAKIAHIGMLLFERRLTDAAGGNISARVGDVLCMTPRFSGSKKLWQLRPEDVLLVDLDANIIDGVGELSRETKVHFRLHREFGDLGTAVIHAHARNILVFAAMARSMPPVLEATRKFGEVPVVEFAPAHSVELADRVAEAIRIQRARIQKQAAGVIAPWHGLFLIGKDLYSAFDAVERFDTNAYCILMGQLLGMSDLLAEQREGLEAGVARYTKPD